MPFFTVVFCLNFGFQFDYILYFSASCFNINCLLKYEHKIDLLKFADGNVCQAISCSNPGPSPLCTEVGRALVKGQKKECCV